ncbi:MAG: hypothetical protein WCA84_19910 [Ignavibacteriaceae bacterium]
MEANPSKVDLSEWMIEKLGNVLAIDNSILEYKIIQELYRMYFNTSSRISKKQFILKISNYCLKTLLKNDEENICGIRLSI